MRFLNFLVEQTLNGTAGGLKEYVIGLEVFDRDASYDPRLDSIVRVEARRLRLKLQGYYQREGRGDRLRIELPNRGYAPTFRYIEEARCIEETDGSSDGAAATLFYSTISLAALNMSGGDAPTDLFAQGLTDEITFLLSTSHGIQLAARTSAVQSRNREDDVVSIGRRLNVDYILEGNVRRENTNIRVCIQLASAASGFCVWSQAYEQEVQGILRESKANSGPDCKRYKVLSLQAEVQAEAIPSRFRFCGL